VLRTAALTRLEFADSQDCAPQYPPQPATIRPYRCERTSRYLNAQSFIRKVFYPENGKVVELFSSLEPYTQCLSRFSPLVWDESFPVFDSNGRLLTRSPQLCPKTLDIARLGGIEPHK
jgi:hypothetical protein